VDPLALEQRHSAGARDEAISKDGKAPFYGRREGWQDELPCTVRPATKRWELLIEFPVRLFSVGSGPDNKRPLLRSHVRRRRHETYYHAMGDGERYRQSDLGENLGKDRILAAGAFRRRALLLYLLFYGSGSDKTGPM